MLGISFLDTHGKLALRQQSLQPFYCAKVSLVQASAFPGQKGLFLEDQVEGYVQEGWDVLFEPDWECLSKQGLGAFHSLLTVGSEGTVFVPVQNIQPAAVKLQTGIPLGIVEHCESKPTMISTEMHAVSAVVQAKQSGEQEEQLKKLHFSETSLTVVELADNTKDRGHVCAD